MRFIGWLKAKGFFIIHSGDPFHFLLNKNALLRFGVSVFKWANASGGSVIFWVVFLGGLGLKSFLADGYVERTDFV